MKILGVLMCCALLGCAGQQTLDELENQALLSGDWTEVKKREQLLARKGKREGMDCPEGLTGVCYEQGLRVGCECQILTPGRRLSVK